MKVKKKNIIIILSILFVALLAGGINLSLYQPTSINRFISAKLYKTPANTAFVDQNFYNCVVDTYNKKNNASIAYTENLTDEQLQTITNLSCSGENEPQEYKIKNLTGLEKLTSLTELSLSHNEIEQIDISALQNLFELTLSYNKISTIDISNNQKLEILGLGGNQLTTIDVSKNPGLSSLELWQNDLTELDLSNNPDIAYLTISSNKIESIDLSKLEKLYLFSAENCQLQNINLENNIELYYLDISQNYIKNINLEKNTNLAGLDISNNSLSEINITNNTKLVQLSVENDPWYAEDDRCNNTIEYIDLSNNPLLTYVDLENLKIKKIDLSNNLKITTGNFTGNNLEEIILNDSISSSKLSGWFNDQNVNQKKIVLGTGKSIVPDEDIMFYLGEKIITSNEYDIETFINKLGLTGISAKIYDDNDLEITTGNITSGYILKLYDDEVQINSTEIYVINSNIFKDTNMYQCVIDGYNTSTGSTITTGTNLSAEELLKIKTINCSQYSIEDFTGLEKLQNLESLKFRYNENLKSINLSNMKNLKILELESCHLETIDLSNNKELTYLDLSGNYLSEIDLSLNTKLDVLNLRHNYLTKLNIGNNKELTSLDITSNGINTIDLSQNVLLEYVTLDNNNLESIDLSKNIALKYLSIQNSITYRDKKDLDSENKLTSIDISNNELLHTVELAGNQLTAIDLSNNELLLTVELAGNQLTTIDLSKNTRLWELNLSGNNLKNIDITNLGRLQTLGIQENDISELDISNSTEMHWLCASNNNLSEIDLKNNLKLSTVELANNNLSEIDLKNNSKLKTIVLANNKLTNLDVSGQKELNELDLANNNIEEINLSSNTNLTSLKLNNNKLSTIDLSNNTELTTIELNENNLTEIALDNNQKLKYLYLNDNEITNLNLSNNTELNKLAVENNKLTKLDLTANIKLAHSTNINLLKIKGNPFQVEQMVLKDTYTKIESPVLLPNGNSNNLKKVISEDESILEKENMIMVKKTGDYKFNAIFYYTIGSYNTEEEERMYTVSYNVKAIEPATSDKYTIDGTYNYIFTGTDTDENTILNNITVEVGTKEIIDNQLVIKYNDEIIHQYAIVNIASPVYDLSKDYIFTIDEEFDEAKLHITNGELRKSSNSTVTIVYNSQYLKTYNLLNIKSEKYKMTKDYIYIGTEKYDTEVLNNITTKNVNISIDEDALVVKFRGTEIDRIALFAIDFGELPEVNNKVLLTSALEYSELISNITTMGLTYKIFSGETEITSGDITEGMTIKVYYNDTELDTYDLTNEYLDLSNLTIDEERPLIKGLQLGTTVENIKELILTSGTITFYDKNNEVLSDASKVTSGTKVVIELSTSTYTYILSVKGDVTGTGESNVADVAKLYQYMKNKIDMEYCYVEAGNVIGDTLEIKVNDVAKLYQYIKGKIDSLEA